MKKEKEKEARWDEGVRNDGVDEYNSIIIAKKEQLKRLVIFLSYRKKRRQKDAFPLRLVWAKWVLSHLLSSLKSKHVKQVSSETAICRLLSVLPLPWKYTLLL